MKTTIIFSHTESGHILEYYTHLYNSCLGHQERRFVFVVPEGFKSKMNQTVWQPCDHIQFDYLPQVVINEILKCGYWKFAWKITKLLREKVIQYHADRVLSLFWFPLVPFGPLLIPSYSKVSAIFYDIYLRDVNTMSKKARAKNKLLYCLLARSSRIYKCYVLNDNEQAVKLNKLFKTEKFIYLPDPYVPIEFNKDEDFRKTYNIPESAIVLSHFGGLAKRKGTINILKAIKLLTPEERASFYFVFAGVVYTDIRDEFYSLVKELTCDSNIIVEDRFCSYDFLAELCCACDAILIPYLYTNRSSGLLGYASQFGKPLLAPNNGLLGELVNKYHLGITDNVDTSEDIYKIIKRFASEKVKKPGFDYCKMNSVERFIDVVRISLID